MRSIPPLLLADLQKSVTSIAFVWSISMGNGRVIRGTEHDLDITIPTGADWPGALAGTYNAISNVTAGDVVSNSDMTVDNLEVSGAMPEDPHTEILDITVDEIEAGLLDMAPVAIIICNWQAPDHGAFQFKGGYLGAITRDSDFRYTTEVRGLGQLLQQTIMESLSTTCTVVKFGDARCKFNVAPITITGAVTAVTSRQQFSVSLAQASPIPPFSYRGGILTFTSGANTGFAREVKLDPNLNGGVLTTWDDFPEMPADTDAFTLSPGCDRQPGTCFNIYANMVNWRGGGLFIPGVNAILAGPTQVAAL